MLRRLCESQEGESATIVKKREEHSALVDSAREKIDEIDTFHNEILTRWTVPDQRIIGEIVHVEPINVNVTSMSSPGTGP